MVSLEYWLAELGESDSTEQVRVTRLQVQDSMEVELH